MDHIDTSPNAFIVCDKTTGEVWISRRGKRQWRLPGHAKSAYNAGRQLPFETVEDACRRLGVPPRKKRGGSFRTPLFDEQKVWEIISV